MLRLQVPYNFWLHNVRFWQQRWSQGDGGSFSFTSLFNPYSNAMMIWSAAFKVLPGPERPVQVYPGGLRGAWWRLESLDACFDQLDFQAAGLGTERGPSCRFFANCSAHFVHAPEGERTSSFVEERQHRTDRRGHPSYQQGGKMQMVSW